MSGDVVELGESVLDRKRLKILLTAGFEVLDAPTVAQPPTEVAGSISSPPEHAEASASVAEAPQGQTRKKVKRT